MKAIVKSAPKPGTELVTDWPEPTVADNEILIDVRATSVCGSDRSFYHWGPAAQTFDINFPCVLGHEGSGVVTEVGKAVTNFSVGDRVALDSHASCGKCYQCRIGNGHNCNNGLLLGADINGVFAERASVPASMAFPIPDEMSFETAALLEPAGVGWHAIQRADKQIAGNVVVVSGCGPIGLLIITYAQLLGAADIIAIEPNPYRRGIAEQRGAKVFEPGDDAQNYVDAVHAYRGGADVAFEVSGVAGAYPAMFEILRRNGTLISVGQVGEPVPVSIANHLNKKEITMRGIYGRLLWSTWEDLSLLIRTGKLDLEWMITDRLEMGELGPVIDMLAGESNKIMIYPNGAPAL